jgi:UDP-glucuronate 4-epimerase
MEKLLITGSGGFVGYHLTKRLSAAEFNIVGLDNLNDYYDVNLKIARLYDLRCFATPTDHKNEQVAQHSNNSFLRFEKIDLVEKEKLFELFEREKFDYVIHLAAQAGVRYSIENPYAYIDSNILGFMNILEACRNYPVKHLIYASSSSVYGANVKQPFSENHNVDHPVSLYAATKKSNELMAHTYSSLYNIPTTGLRFFTVYGPWGRPDMAYFSFTKDIIEGNTINVFNNGNLERDFTYIDDIIEGIVRLIEEIPQKNESWDKLKSDPATSFVPYRVFNIGNNKPVKLIEFINILEEIIGKKAVKNYLPMQKGDVYSTFADIDLLNVLVGFNPQTNLKDGLKKFVDWYIEYYH